MRLDRRDPIEQKDRVGLAGKFDESAALGGALATFDCSDNRRARLDSAISRASDGRFRLHRRST